MENLSTNITDESLIENNLYSIFIALIKRVSISKDIKKDVGLFLLLFLTASFMVEYGALKDIFNAFIWSISVGMIILLQNRSIPLLRDNNVEE